MEVMGLKCGNKSDASGMYCYVIIKPIVNKIFNTLFIANPYSLESPFGEHEIYINSYGDLQIKSSYLILVDKHSIKKNRVLYLYNGNLILGGIITEWSKTPIKHKVNKIEKYKNIKKQIDELKTEQYSLFTK